MEPSESVQDRNPLEPLLFRLACDFSDDQDLSDRLQRLYQVLRATLWQRGAGEQSMRGVPGRLESDFSRVLLLGTASKARGKCPEPRSGPASKESVSSRALLLGLAD